MEVIAFFAVGTGAALGAWLRWGLGIALNPIFPTVPLGTLAANLSGGFLMGITIALLGTYPAAPPELRLAITTGFLGGFTTFSTFSAEVVTLLGNKQYFWAMTAIATHVIGSLVLTAVGISVAYWIFRKGSP